MPAKPASSVLEISTSLHDNVEYLNARLGLPSSWDIIAKHFRFGNIDMMSYVTNGFFTTNNMVKILAHTHECIRTFVQDVDGREFAIAELVDYLQTNIPFVQVQTVKHMEEAIHFILSGPLVTFYTDEIFMTEQSLV